MKNHFPSGAIFRLLHKDTMVLLNDLSSEPSKQPESISNDLRLRGCIENLLQRFQFPIGLFAEVDLQSLFSIANQA